MTITKDEVLTTSKIVDRLFTILRLASPPMATYHGAAKWEVMLDLEKVNDVCPLDFDVLLAFPVVDFLHDMAGIYRHFDRTTLQLTDCFAPRCLKRETVRCSKCGERVPADTITIIGARHNVLGGSFCPGCAK